MLQLYIFVIAGFALAQIFKFTGVENVHWYSVVIATLLAFGLYGSTFGISLQDARKHFKLILSAVTIGVLVKALIIGSLLTFILKNPYGFVLGIIVAQIDPLSTAALQKGKRLSRQAKTILAAWSSFDDPMTVILSLYAPVFIALVIGTQWQAIGGSMQDAGLQGYFAETGMNLLFALGVFTLWMLIKRFGQAANYLVVIAAAIGMYILVVATFSTAITYFWMLGIAIIGLFMRPPIQALMEKGVEWSLCIAAILLGVLLIKGIDPFVGITLGCAAFGAQIVVGFMLTRKLSSKDRTHIAFAQQNGITSIILALLFEPYYPGTIAVVAPAILTANTLHAVTNKAYDMYLEGSHHTFSLTAQLRKIRIHMDKLQ